MLLCNALLDCRVLLPLKYRHYVLFLVVSEGERRWVDSGSLIAFLPEGAPVASSKEKVLLMRRVIVASDMLLGELVSR